MNKRLRKKMHRKYVSDVLEELSMFGKWRELLRDTPAYEKILIDAKNMDTFTSWVATPAIKYHLKYTVYKDPLEGPIDSTEVIFVVQARDYPNIKWCSYNNLEII